MPTALPGTSPGLQNLLVQVPMAWLWLIYRPGTWPLRQELCDILSPCPSVVDLGPSSPWSCSQDTPPPPASRTLWPAARRTKAKASSPPNPANHHAKAVTRALEASPPRPKGPASVNRSLEGTHPIGGLAGPRPAQRRGQE